MISLILYGRNDSYGYNLHKRAAISLNCMAEVLDAPDDEIIFVDYNTPDDFPTFPEAIADTLTNRAKALLRILRVRPRQHEQFRAKTHLLALEPISRNVAVRRSNPRNRWVLSTNTDMVFVPRLGRSLSKIAGSLPDAFYHLPRFELPETLWESLNRGDPADIIAKLDAWGRRFHLNEIVFAADPEIKYDAPGDFQLMLREDVWRINGFNESMLLGWHVDSNIAKRLALLPRATGSLVEEMFGYHCDHTRQVTPMHRPQRTENSLETFVDDVAQPEVEEQAETWGLAGEHVEEVSIETTRRLYLDALRVAVTSELSEPGELTYSGEMYNRTDYSVEHVIPFLTDAFAGYPRGVVAGWLGGKRSLLQRFADAWQAQGFLEPVRVLNSATWLGPDLPPCCRWASETDAARDCDIFVFDWGKPDERESQDFYFETDETICTVSRGFRHIAQFERDALRIEPREARRFVGINTINNSAELLFDAYVAAPRTPLSTRIRQGYVTAEPISKDLLPSLEVGDAGQRTSDGIRARPGVSGIVFRGTVIVADRHYRLNTGLDDVWALRSRARDAGLTLAVLYDSYLVGYRSISREDAHRGRVSLLFSVMEDITKDAGWSKLELMLRSTGSFDFSVHDVELETRNPSGPEEVLDIAGLDVLPLMLVGSAGVVGPAPSSRFRAPSYPSAIYAKPKVEGHVVFGPYIRLRPGNYEATLGFCVDPLAHGTEVMAEVVTDRGARFLAQEHFPLLGGEQSAQGHRPVIREMTLLFQVSQPLRESELIEFRVWSPGTAQFAIAYLRISSS